MAVVLLLLFLCADQGKAIDFEVYALQLGLRQEVKSGTLTFSCINSDGKAIDKFELPITNGTTQALLPVDAHHLKSVVFRPDNGDSDYCVQLITHRLDVRNVVGPVIIDLEPIKR